jgi:hypothetical protein
MSKLLCGKAVKNISTIAFAPARKAALLAYPELLSG